MFALGMLPSFRQAACADTVQSWFADDSSAAGHLCRLRRWWDVLTKRGRAFGYFVNAKKSVLVMKEECLLEARNLFQDTGVETTSDGARYSGAAIVSSAFKYVIDVEPKDLLQLHTRTSVFISGM